MGNYIDYVYYRLCKLYYRYDGSTGVHAMLIITLTEGVLLLDVILFFTHYFYTLTQVQTLKNGGYVLVALSIVPLALYNYLNYIKPAKKFDKLNNILRNEAKKSKIINGFSVLVFLLSPWIVLYSLNRYFGN